MTGRPARVLVLAVLCLALVRLAVGGEDDAAARPTFTVRVLPRRVEARLPVAPGASAEATQATLKRLAGWAQRGGYGPVGGPHVVSALLDLRKPPIPTEVRVAVNWSKRALPPTPATGARLIRTEAQVVLTWTQAGGPQALATTLAGLAPVLRRLRLSSAGSLQAAVDPEAPDGLGARRFMALVVTPVGRADVGLYADFGAHPNAIRAAGNACLAAGLSVRVLHAQDLNQGALQKHIHCLLMPGGWAADYTTDIDPAGTRHVRRFVERGGGYVGVCAGAFYAMDRVVWQAERLDYPLNLVPGSAMGPVKEIAPWPEHALASLRLSAAHALTKGLGSQRQVFYLGGPVLVPAPDLGRKAQVVARYAEGGGVAIVTVERGRGRVFLSGVHLEYDLTSMADGLAWPESEGILKDAESDWDLFQRGVRWAVGRQR